MAADKLYKSIKMSIGNLIFSPAISKDEAELYSLKLKAEIDKMLKALKEGK